MFDSKNIFSVMDVDSALSHKEALYVDVRSPSEYANGKLPGAVNIPLFNDAERAVVGTLYKQKGRAAAMNYGLMLFSQKLPDFIDQFKALPREKKIIVYCWRGGMRSKTAVIMAGLADVRVCQLLGGYKQYRARVLQELGDYDISADIIVLCGSTGSGKTDLLKLLEQQGIAVVDLEGLANHRGSAFGGIGLGKLQTAHNFDALLLAALNKYATSKYIIVECESKRIGNVYLPDCLFSKMASGKKILIRTKIGQRAKRLVREYTERVDYEYGELENSLSLLERKFGKKLYSQLAELLASNQYEQFTELLLERYYDPLYNYEKASNAEFNAVVDGTCLEIAAQEIVALIKEWYE